MLDAPWERGPAGGFTLQYHGPAGIITQSFTAHDSALFSHVEWVSTDGTVVVMEGMLGWNAYLQPNWKRVARWGYGTKEEAAFAGILASLRARAEIDDQRKMYK